MKKLVLFTCAILFLAGCGNKQKGGEATKAEDVNTFELSELFANADNYIGKPVNVSGYVTHVCSHSGRKCFLEDENQKFSIRVEATDKIGSFDQELVGAEIKVSGILQETRLTEQQICDQETMVEEQLQNEEITEESCEASKANIAKMREWMENNGKDYYAVYFIDGESYNEIQ